MDNGLYRDVNNHPNGSLTLTGAYGVLNLTGLYDTAACIDVDCDGCAPDCMKSMNVELRRPPLRLLVLTLCK